ncbi:putative bacteriocin export ABC transporter [Peptoniphilaceae bacterium SGI.137]
MQNKKGFLSKLKERVPDMLQLRNLGKRYGKKILFQNLHLTIEDGESVAIIGKSGSGKSTLLNIMSLIEQPSSGKICWDGKEYTAGSRQAALKMRKEIGYLFQNYALIDQDTVEKNIRIGLKYNTEIRDKKEAIRNALETVGLSGMEKQKIYTLSGGEQQRVALARLLVKPCSVIFADEPTGNLDDENGKKVMDILFDMNRSGKTIVVVTHDENLLYRFQKVVKL